MAEFIKACGRAEVAEGNGRVVVLNGQQIALFNLGGTFYATDDSCTHVGGPLSEGELEGTVVTCPLHGATFDVTDGRALGPPAGADLTCYEVKVEGDAVRVKV